MHPFSFPHHLPLITNSLHTTVHPDYPSTTRNVSCACIHSPTIQLFTATRLTYHTPSNFTTVISKFYAELGTPSTLAFPAVAKNITGYDASNKAEFIASIEKAVGPKGFMLFAVRFPSFIHSPLMLSLLNPSPVSILDSE